MRLFLEGLPVIIYSSSTQGGGIFLTAHQVEEKIFERLGSHFQVYDI